MLPEFHNHISHSDGNKDMTIDQPQPKITEIQEAVCLHHSVKKQKRLRRHTGP